MQYGQEQDDEAFARQLQAEENAAADRYYQHQRNNESNGHDFNHGPHYRIDGHPSQAYNPLAQASSFPPVETGTAQNEAVSREYYPEPSIEVLAYPVFAEDPVDDEIIARNLQQEIQDEEIARALNEREEQRLRASMRNSTLSNNSTVGVRGNTSSRPHAAMQHMIHSPPSQRSVKRSICYGGIIAIIIGFAAIMVVCFGEAIWLRFNGNDNDNLQPYFGADWGKGDGSPTGSFSQWSNDKKGLPLKIQNALSSDWDKYFVQAVSDWNAAPALALSIKNVAEDPKCEKVNGLLKVCNADYTETTWTGLNELYYIGSFIVASVAKMNEFYLSAKDTSAAERQYVMCHEIGHAFGLPHRDEIPNNPDLLSCLDYTYRFKNNKMPDVLVDFDNLTNLYGVIGTGKQRMLRNSGADENLMAKTADSFHGLSRRDWHYTEGRILHKSDRREIYENDLGDGVRVVTTLLLAKQPLTEDEK